MFTQREITCILNQLNMRANNVPNKTHSIVVTTIFCICFGFLL